MPFSSPSSSLAVSNLQLLPSAPPVSLASPTHQLQQPSPTPVRMLSSKLPKGRHLIGNHVVYDIDVRLQGEKVTDMVFFAEDVHLLASTCIDGRIFIRKINEGPDEEEKPQIFERIVLALQIITEGESVHPRVCWHPHKQEILMVAIGNRILKIDTIKVGKGEGFSAEKPLNCSIDKLIDGVQLAGKHEGEVTELSMCQWMTTRLASASSDGTVKIWEDRKAVPLAMLRPHDGNPVNSVTFLTSPYRPDHIVLITTGGRLNQEVKVWASAMEEGWLLPSDAESWQCSQTLTLKSSAESSVEDAFFNQVVALPRAGLFLLANAKKNAIYAIHIEYGPYPAATRMDYIAEFTVTMPILSLTGTSDSLPNGEHVVQVYCVQTQAIQQYALDLSQCLPPPLENVELEKTESNVSHVFDAASSDGSTITESSHGSKTVDVPIGKGTSIQPMVSSSSENAPAASHPESLTSAEVNTLPDSATSVVETKASALPSQNSIGNLNTVSPSLPLSPQLSRKLSGFQGPSNSIEPSMQPSDHVDQPGLDYLVEHRMDTAKENMADIPSGDNLRKGEKNIAQTDISVVPESPVMFKHPTHLITPSEILSRAASSSENSQISQCMNVGESKVQDVVANNDMESIEVEVKVVGETGTNQSNDFDLPRESHATVPEKKEKSFYSQASDLSIQMARDCCVEAYNVGGIRQAGENGVTEVPDRPPNSGEDEEQEIRKDVPAKVGESETPVVVSQSQPPLQKGKNRRGKTLNCLVHLLLP
ncbi:hypothetical protein GH714_039518 [Hevea brasiliensis]|uniref:Enhancer of mRNA-decapping protein 4 WD40 repeat region domain-containing protein n=1 Tax=Hevea brasiliensis TaxID=3981 RepID=A0A6A6MJZ1_HEVBR|nr:hypothetical protein GH714_039518 [Hevea brasiliensis]